MAQGASSENRLRSLNGQAVSLLARYQSGDANGQAQARAEALTVFADRRNALDALIASNPAAALQLAFPEGLLQDLAAAFPASAGSLEARGRWEGELEYVIQDGTTPENTRDIFSLHMGARTARLIPAGQISGNFKCGDRVAASGVQSGNTIVAGSATVVAAANAVCSTVGAQNIAVIIVNMPGYAVTTPSDTTLKGIFLGNAASGETISPNVSISDFWSKNSDGKTWINGSGTGALTVVPVTLAQNYAYCTCGTNGCSDNSGAARQAAYAAADPFINYADYSRVVLIFPNNGTCSGIAGVGTIGCWGGENPGDGQSTISWTWWRADQTANRSSGVMLGTHEMGHNLGMGHSGSRDHGAEVIGPIGTAGTRTEYGDVFGTMGSWNYGFYNAQHSVQQIGWMNTSNYIDVTQTGVYTISPFDAQGNAVKALRVKRGTMTTSAWFWIAYYPTTGGWYLDTLSSQIHSGAIIHAQDSATPGGKTDLVDFTPATTSFNDPALAVGQCWQDPYTDVQICASAVVNGQLQVTVNYSLPPCTNANPTVSFNAGDLAKSTAAGTAAQFGLTVTNNDSSTCAARTFSMSTASPTGTGWNSSFSANPNLAPGATATVTMTVTPATTVPLTTYDVSATATSAFNNGTTGTSTATTSPVAALTVTAPPPTAPAAPSSVSASVATTGTKTKLFQSFTVRWTDNSNNESGFELRRCLWSGKGGSAKCTYDAWSATTAINATSYSSTVKPPSGSYRFEVRSYNNVGPSNWVAAANVTIP